jgi:hypothetical protein
MIGETWSYQDKRYFDKKGERWHFMFHHLYDTEKKYEEMPYELYFRNDKRTQFGILKFEKLKDNPYRDFKTVVNKILNDEDFRKSLLDPLTRGVWKRK